jgi:alanine-glyoxylate transaminase / serine-glyoxylate transaminase / serine-pyruvate transaminase
MAQSGAAYTDLNPSPRVLLGPGPSAVHPRVLRAMSTPVLGYLDPEFFTIMDETQAMLRTVFQTSNEMTLPVSGTGSAGMETAICNFVEPGDRVLVCICGFFGQRLAEMAERYGGQVERLEKPWGEVFTLEEIKQALGSQPVKVVAIVHAETSTGALQPMDGIADLVHQHGGLLVVDCVTSLGGVAVKVDDWNADVVYSGTQKCLGCPPGLAPVTVSPKAVAALAARKTTTPNWYLDLNGLWKYWGKERGYHHTVSGSLVYALREGLRLVVEEGLEERFARHRANAERLWAGLEALDLSLHVPAAHRLPTLTTVRVAELADEAGIRTRLRDEYNIEIAGGFGPLKGQIWRIGLMGYSSRRENVTLLLAALREVLGR